MKRLFSFLLLLISIPVLAQETTVLEGAPDAKDVIVEFNGGKYQGHLIEYNSPSDLVEESVKEQFNLQGVKPKSIKDFLVYRNVRVSNIDPVNPVDVFIKVERKSKKEKDQTLVYLIATKPGEIPDEKVKSNSTASGLGITTAFAGGTFLKAMHPGIEVKKHARKVSEKEEEIAKAEKKLRNLQDDQASLEKKIKQYQKDLEENKKAQEAQVAELGNHKKILEDLNNKKPSAQ
jgi:hypothetical protein